MSNNFGIDMTKFAQLVEAEDQIEETTETSSKETFLRKRIVNGQNFFWLVPQLGEDPRPWTYFDSHHQPFAICLQAPATVKIVEGRGQLVRSKSKMSDCPRCVVNFEEHGYGPDKENKDRESWLDSSARVKWNEDKPKQKVGFIAVPCDFLMVAKKLPSGRSEYVLRPDAQKAMDAFMIQYKEFLSTRPAPSAGTYFSKETVFEFNYDDTQYITGIQSNYFSAFVWATQSNLEGEIRSLLLDQGVQPWGLTSDMGIPCVLSIERTKTAKSSNELENTSYALKLITLSDTPKFTPEFVQECLKPNLIEAREHFAPLTQDEMLEKVRADQAYKGKGSLADNPECFGDAKVYGRFRTECYSCRVQQDCRKALSMEPPSFPVAEEPKPSASKIVAQKPTALESKGLHSDEDDDFNDLATMKDMISSFD